MFKTKVSLERLIAEAYSYWVIRYDEVFEEDDEQSELVIAEALAHLYTRLLDIFGHRKKIIDADRFYEAYGAILYSLSHSMKVTNDNGGKNLNQILFRMEQNISGTADEPLSDVQRADIIINVDSLLDDMLHEYKVVKLHEHA